MGDMSLALWELVPESTGELALGEIPHHIAYKDGATKGHNPDILIDLTSPPETVIEQASRCAKIVSSSLHGIILADVLGVPSLWVQDKRVLGDGFKFRDYAAALGQTIEPGEWRQAPVDRVEEIGKQMADLIRMVGAG